MPDLTITSEETAWDRLSSLSSSTDGERKTVTALFADIKGSMELMEQLDPEEARAIIDPALQLMIAAVHRYDGYLVQSTGDGIFALFGAPVAHEDHPQRALHAALRMQEEMRRYAERLRAERGLSLQVRVGINTGEVVVRSLQTDSAHAEYTPIGHSTGLAARLQTLANPGAVVISAQVAKLVEGYFQLKSLGLARIKGVNDPVGVFEVAGIGPLRTRLQAAARRGLTRFVGREAELAQIRRALELARGGHGQVVAAIGEPGVGKSRLFFEFKAIAEGGCLVLEAYSISHGKASAYLPVIELLRGYFQITAEDDERRRREKVAGKVLMLDRSLEDTLPYLFSLMGIQEGGDPLAQMDSQVRRKRMQEAIKRILLRESLNQPLIIVFEDLHWIDGETEVFLTPLADGIATARVLLLVNYRPEYHHEWSNRTSYTQFRLDPLGRETAEEMLNALLTSPAPAALPAGANGERSRGDIHVDAQVRVQDDLAALKRLIIERTEGNPLFVEEMVQALFEQGALLRNGRVNLRQSLAEIKIPPTVQAVLASRIDRLPPSEKELLQTVAVMGREFTLGLVQRVAGASEPGLERMLGDLQSGEFIYEQPAFPEVEYVFKHALTQEVAYNSLLSERRKLLHERAAAAMEALYIGRLDDHLIELGRHYQRSGNSAKAIEYLQRAGAQAVTRSAHAEAIGLFTSALELLKTMPETPGRMHQELTLQLGLGSALSATTGVSTPETGQAFERASELCGQLGATPHLFAVLVGLAQFYSIRAEFHRAYELAQQALAIAELEGDAVSLVEASAILGPVLLTLGDFAAAQSHLERAIAAPEPALSQSLPFEPRVISLCFKALFQILLGYPDQALMRSREALALARKLSHPFTLVGAMGLSSLFHRLRGEGEESLSLYEETLRLASEHGFQQFVAVALAGRGLALIELNRVEEGIAQLRGGLSALRATGMYQSQTIYLAELAEGCGKAGRTTEGLEAVAEGLAAADRTGECMYEAELYRVKGDLLMQATSAASNAAAEAESCFRQAI